MRQHSRRFTERLLDEVEGQLTLLLSALSTSQTYVLSRLMCFRFTALSTKQQTVAGMNNSD